MTKSVFRFGIAGLVVSLLSVSALSASAQNLGAVKPGETNFHFKDICIRSLFGINDEVLADTDRFPLNDRGFSSIKLGVRFGDFTNATVTISKDRDTGKPGLSEMRFYKEFGPETDDKELLREYERTVDLVSKLLGVKVECRGLADPNANVRRWRGVMHLPGLPGSGRITSRTSLRLAKGHRVEIEATEASYVIRSGQPIQTASPIVSVRFCRIPFGTRRSEGDDAESVKELTLGLDYSELLSVKMRVKKEELKLQELKTQNQKESLNRPQLPGGSMFGSLRAMQAERRKRREADAADAAAKEKAAAEAKAKEAEDKALAEENIAQMKKQLNELVEANRLAREEKARKDSEAAEAAEAAKSGNSVAETNNTVKAEKISVAEKLGTCDFLLNKDFKKNAKYYLCLFSASWCPPCRREMPRIAKTYVDTLKDDPDIELIHFSRDQNDDKALAWAKEHDVKFPVVKPNGGNPLDLKPSGIPHLFILKADGTLVEHDHPMRIFNEEKFSEIKSGNVKVKPHVANVELKNGEGAEQVGGYLWTYRLENGCATIVAAGGLGRCTISPVPHGDVVIPAKLGDMSVTSIGDFAFWECGQLTSVTIPSSVKSICAGAFWNCCGLTSVTMRGERPTAGSQMFAYCGKLKEIHVPANAKSWAGMKEWQGIPLVFD